MAAMLRSSVQRWFSNVAANAPSKFNFDQRLLNVLVCPLTKKALRYDEAAQELVSEDAKLAYKIVDGIPNMLVTDARKI